MRVRAVRIREAGDPSVLAVESTEVRDPGPGEVAIEVRAAGLNRADLLQRRGLYPAPPGSSPDVPGLEYAGRVAALGPGVASLSVGDPVMGITGGGAMAERIVQHEREVIPAPPGLPLEQAAAIPEAFFTAFDAARQAGLTLGDVALIHSVGSGVGTAALQLANAAGARVIGTSRTRGKLDRCAALGLAEGVLVEDGRFAQQVLERSGTGASVILDGVGAPYLEENLKALAPRGRLVVIGTMGGRDAQLPLSLLLSRRATVIGTVLRARPLEEKAALARAFAAHALPLFAAGRLAPVIEEILPMDRVREAHERLERNETFGKIVLAW
jgi:putative PIG3 family NAD(P)H quinone oxidoreductase